MTGIGHDLRYAFRGLARNPGFTTVAVLTLALGIGANSAIFSAVNAVLIRPLPYPDADRLVQVWETNPGANRWGDWASYPDFLDWQRENRVFDGVAAYRNRLVRLNSGEQPEMLVGVRVSPELFSVLRVNPMLGRSFLVEEGADDRNDVAILGYGLWQRQFGSDPGLVGKTILIDGRNHLVVGVMPPGFDFPANIQGTARIPEVWTPMGTDRARGSHNYRVIARLRADRTIEQAQTEMNRLAQYIAEVDPGHRGRGATLAGLQEHTTTTVRPALFVLIGAIFVVLVIACVNVAGLLLARGAARQKEIALRVALGAGRTRVLQQWLIESVVLALIGGVAGLLVAFVGIRFLIDLAPAMPLIREASIDIRVLTFTAAIALITGLAFGVAPAFQALKIKANVALNERGMAQGGGSRIRSVLTVAEIALAVMLLVGAGLLVRSFVQLRNVDVGFDADNVLTAFLSLPPNVSEDADRTVAFLQNVLARAEQIPGVSTVAGASAVPLISNESSPFRVEGRDNSDRTDNIVYAEQPKITPGYFRVMRIGLLRGREFGEVDSRSSQPVAIVSETLAQTYWPGEDALGKRLSIDDRQWRTIVGIVRDVKHDGLERPARPTIYIPFAQYPRSMLTLLVRSDANSTALVGALRQSVTEVDKNQPLFGIQTMDQILSESISLKRFLMMLLGIFAVVAVILGTVGVYGVLAYLVSQRRQEIGIRMALGASRFQVVTLILRHGTLLAVAGVGLGVLGSLALSGVLSGMLFGVSATDPWTFSVIPALLFVVTLLASSVPAFAAASVDPMRTVRGE